MAVTCRVAESHDALHGGDALLERIVQPVLAVFGPVEQVDAFGTAVRLASYEALIEGFGDERRERRDQPGGGRQDPGP